MDNEKIIRGLDNLLSQIGAVSALGHVGCNPVAQKLLSKAMDGAVAAITKSMTKISSEIRKQVIAELPGLKGALSRIERLTGKECNFGFEDDSEVGLLVSDKFKATGLQSKFDRIFELHHEFAVKVDMATDAQVAIQLVRDFANKVTLILAEQPNPIKL